nr:hypothetical protein [Tanacetum cinerariifolium]
CAVSWACCPGSANGISPCVRSVPPGRYAR